MITLLIFLAVLSILVLSHEYGHFITARKNGIKVEEFGFGFPPRLFGVRRVSANGKKRWQIVWGKSTEADTAEYAGTLYSVNIIPLGGFVKIKGETAGAQKAGDSDSFATKRAWQKMLVLSAGVIMNILVAIVLFSIGFMVGVPQTLDNWADVSAVPDHHVQILGVLPGSPAELARLQAGDQIIKIDALARPRLAELQSYVDSRREGEIQFTIQRGNEQVQSTIKPTVNPDSGKGVIGVAITEVGTVRYPWYRAIGEGVKLSFVSLGQIFSGFYELIHNLIVGKGVGSAVSGPVGVAVMTGEVARMGFTYLIQFVAILSLNLAVLNILPIPALDGGRLLFVIIEAVLRRPVKAKIEETAHFVGFAALMLLVVVITVRDVGALSGPVLEWVKNIF